MEPYLRGAVEIQSVPLFKLDEIDSKADRSTSLGIYLWSENFIAARMTTSINSVNAQRHPLRGGWREIMLENSDDLMSIVVLEAGAAWPTWLTEYQRLAPNAVVIAQARSELPDAFRSRVLHRLAEAMASAGARIRVGVLVAGDSPDDDRLALRGQLARPFSKRGSGTKRARNGGAARADGARNELSAGGSFARAGEQRDRRVASPRPRKQERRDAHGCPLSTRTEA